jgi:hypothetical protein
MSKIKQYIQLSKRAKAITEIYEEPEKFLDNYLSLEPIEQQSYINHLIVNNIPFAFRDIPLLYEQIIQYLADVVELDYCDIKLIGSAKTGFSISPKPNYGNPFNEKSDLDFSIINNGLFEKLKSEFYLWADLYSSKKMIPKSEKEKRYWDDNFKNVPLNLYNGFIDTYKIPNREHFVLTRKLNDSLYLITFKIKEFHNINNEKASLRIYQNWSTFHKQLKRNTEFVLKNSK